MVNSSESSPNNEAVKIAELEKYLGERGFNLDQINPENLNNLDKIKIAIIHWGQDPNENWPIAKIYVDKIENLLDQDMARRQGQSEVEVGENKKKLEQHGGPFNWVIATLGESKDKLKRRLSGADPGNLAIFAEANSLFRTFAKKMGSTDFELELGDSRRLGFSFDDFFADFKKNIF